MITKVVKLSGSVFLFFLDRVVNLLFRIIDKKSPTACVVLYYHSILKSQKNNFAKQMKCIKRWAQPVSANGRVNFKANKIQVLVTFDDGFESVINFALPALIRFNIPSVFFIPSGYLGEKPEWEGIGPCEKNKERVITEDQLKKLPLDLMAIGSHCVTHPRLPEIPDETAKNEIYESKNRLENISRKQVYALSFPYGAFNEKHVAWSRDAGYKRVFSNLPILNYPGSGEFVWGRIGVEPSDWPLEFLLKVYGAYRWLPAAFMLKAKCRSFYEKVNRSSTER